MTTETSRPALKERAGVVNALLDGVQTVLVRHPTLDPGTITDRFVLYPAYTHQRPERYQSRHVGYYYRASTKPEAGVPIRGVADLEGEFSVPIEAVPELARHYVYTPAGLCEKYDPDEELRVLLLRVHELDSPAVVEERGAYRGCRAWIDIAADLDFTRVTPVLDDAAFAERQAAIRDRLE